MKIVLNIAFIFVGLLIGLNSYASSLFATRLPGIDLSRSSVQSGGDTAILQNEFLIYADYDDDLNKRVVKYSLKTNTSEIIHIEPEKTDYSLKTTSDRFYTDGSVVYFVLDGRLYFSDGTNTGTKFVKDYGIYLQKYQNVPALSDGKVINQKLYFTFSPESERGVNGDFAVNPFLWRTDGTQSGTVQYANTDQTYRVGDLFIQEGYDPNIVFFFRRSTDIFELWRTTPDDSAIQVMSFYEEDQQYVNQFSTAHVVHNSKGSYFCTVEDGAYEGGLQNNLITKLWRVSNSGIVDFITRGCALDSLYEFNDEIYFKSATGLHHTSGLQSDINTVYSADLEIYSNSESLCEIDNKLYASLTSGTDISLLELDDSGGQRDLINKSRDKRQRARISNCFADNLIFYETEISSLNNEVRFQHWLIDPKIDQMLEIKTNEALDRYPLQTARRTTNLSSIVVCGSLFCIVDGAKLALPMILDLILEGR